jgi:hypothetical protein
MTLSASDPVAAELTRPISYYTGYDPEFLGCIVALPVLSDEQRRTAARNSATARARTTPCCRTRTSAW